MTEQLRDVTDLRPRAFEIGDEIHGDDAQALRGQHAPRHRPVVRPDQNKVGLQHDGGFGLPVELAVTLRFARDHGQAGIRRVRREPCDLLRIGERDHQLVGAKVERGHAARDIGRGRRDA